LGLSSIDLEEEEEEEEVLVCWQTRIFINRMCIWILGRMLHVFHVSELSFSKSPIFNYQNDLLWGCYFILKMNISHFISLNFDILYDLRVYKFTPMPTKRNANKKTFVYVGFINSQFCIIS
jgi:hypothetical protein